MLRQMAGGASTSKKKDEEPGAQFINKYYSNLDKPLKAKPRSRSNISRGRSRGTSK